MRTETHIKRALKFAHSVAGAGIIGALAGMLLLLTVTPDPTSIEEYALMRQGMSQISTYLLFPSLGVVLVSGLLSMAVHRPFHNAGWAWMKLGLGVVMFEGTLLAVHGPVQRAARESQRALAGEIDPATLHELVTGEWDSMWVIMGVSLVNVVLGVWRPRFTKRRTTQRSETAVAS
ncbi:MAG: hypothetical protein AAGI24_06160 [Pseudomonadota bacterium]